MKRRRLSSSWETSPARDRALPLRPAFEAMERRCLLAPIMGVGAPIMVTKTSDDGSMGTLRAAINQANGSSGPAVIDFAIPGTGVQTIALGSDLPALINPVTIDGTSQTGYQGTPLIVLAAGTSGASPPIVGLDFAIGSDGSAVRGLDLEGFGSAAILISANSVTVAANEIGTDPTGTISRANGNGIEINGASNTVGGTTAADRNLISANTDDGILISGAAASGNVVLGNNIGTDVTGMIALGNLSGGVVISHAPGNIVGGTAAGAANVISGNGTAEGQGAGLEIEGSGATGNVVAGNFVGTASGGEITVPNLGFGVAIVGASGNTIGGTAAASRNIISGNTFSGVFLSSTGTTQNLVQGNAIGIAADGIHALGNAGDGLTLQSGAVGNQISGNVISGNLQDGIQLFGAGGNSVLGNIIGTVADGTAALPNQGAAGIVLNAAAANTIGGTTTSSANLVAGNTHAGIAVLGGSSGNLIQGNTIGTNPARAAGLGNGQDGVLVDGSSSNNTIGGTGAGAGNTIADNGTNGVEIASGTGDAILGNDIFANASEGIALGIGGNNNQAFPSLTAVYSTGSSSVVQGTLTSTPNTTFRIEFFANDKRDPSGFGQGQIFLPSATLMVTTGADGTARFSQTVPVILPGSQFVTATATDPNNNTSQFSADAPVTVVSLSIVGMALAEPPSGTANLNFTVTLSAASPLTTTVSYQTVDGTAVAGVDYVTTTGTLTFAPGTTTQVIPVPIIGHSAVGPNKSFSVMLSNAQNAAIATASATGTILNNNVAGQIQFSMSGFTVSQSSGEATITVTRIGGSASAVGVTYSTVAGGTAVPGVDYTTTMGTLTFDANQMSQTFTIPILTNLLLGTSRTVALALSNPSGGGTLGPQSMAVMTILNDNSLVVTNTNDSGPGSLRQALLTANANPGTNTVSFAIPGPGPFVIQPLSGLPTIDNPVIVDATTQPGYQSTPVVTLDGILAGPETDGLDITAGSSTIKGLVIDRFTGTGIVILGGGGDVIAANLIGTDTAGDAGLGNGFDGVGIYQSSHNTIGGNGNVIADNGLVGIRITGAAATGNFILGNLVGTDPTGTRALGNRYDGIFIDGAPGNTIGSSTAGERNVISGNASIGIQLEGPGADGNVFQGNLIGTDVTGTQALGNGLDGIFLDNAARNLIGGAGSADRNIISGNGAVGVRLAGAAASGNVIQGNEIGTGASGTTALGNRYDGIFTINAPNNQIGGTAPGAGNVISANGSVGIQLFGTGSTGNVVQGNLVGTAANGTTPLGNGLDGIFINAAPRNTIGGGGAGVRNVISANGSSGVQLLNPGASGNVIQGNGIGVDINNAPRLGNAYGIFLNNAVRTTLGGPGSAQNVVAGNTQANVLQINGGSGSGVLSVAPTVSGGETAAIVIRYSTPLASSTAQNLGNYRLQQIGRFANTLSVVRLSSAVYDASAQSVTLTLARPVSTRLRLLLTVSGTSGRGGIGGKFTTIIGSLPSTASVRARSVHIASSHVASRATHRFSTGRHR